MSGALTAAALVLAIPVFFDVGFIILVPIIYGFSHAAGLNPVKFGLPIAVVVTADGNTSFTEAVRRKLVLEIAGGPAAGRVAQR